MLGSHVGLTCWVHMLHGFICWVHLLHGFTCWVHMLGSHVGFTCWVHMLGSHVGFTYCMGSHVGFTCMLTLRQDKPLLSLWLRASHLPMAQDKPFTRNPYGTGQTLYQESLWHRTNPLPGIPMAQDRPFTRNPYGSTSPLPVQ